MAGWFRTGTVSPGPATYYIKRDFDYPGMRSRGEYSHVANPSTFLGSSATTPLRRSYSPISRENIERVSFKSKEFSPIGCMGNPRSSSPLKLETYRAPSPPPKEVIPLRKAHHIPQAHVIYDVTPFQNTYSKRATSPLYHSGSRTVPNIRTHSSLPTKTSQFTPTIHNRAETRSQKTLTVLPISSTRSSKPSIGPAFSIKGREIMWQEAWRAMMVNSI